MPIPKNYKLVVVTWEDSFDVNGDFFQPADEIAAENPSYLVMSAGWLVWDGPVVVKIATDLDRDGDLRRTYTIRRENIRDITYLDEAKPEVQ